MRKLKLFSILILSLTCVFSTVFGIAKAFETVDYEFTTEMAVEKTYSLNQEVYFPKGTFVFGSDEITATTIIRLPNGKSYQKSSCVLSESGEYMLEYFTDYAGKRYSEIRKFKVSNTTYSVSGNGSAEYNAELGGLSVKLSAGTTFKYNVPIDISNNTLSDSIISLYVNSSAVGVRDFEQYIITLTDAYDSTNQIHLRAYASDNFGSQAYANVLTYFSAGVQNKNYFAGINNDSGSIAKGGRWGTYLHHSFSGQHTKGNGLEDQASFRIDYANKDFYLHANALGQILKVAELDNPNFFSNTWSGFTSGVCYISITGDSFVNSEAQLVITDIMGQDLTKTVITDNEAPELNIDFGEFDSKNYPDGVIDMPYRIYDYVCHDNLDMSTNVEVAVYMGYYSNKKVSVDLIDGCFVPKYKTVYTIVYTATDDMGNKTVKEIDVNVGELGDYENLTFAIEQIFDDYKAGSILTVQNDIEILSREETFGSLNLKVDLINSKENIALYNGLLNDFNGVDVRLMTMGSQKLVYTLYDYIRSQSVEKSFNVLASDVPVFETSIDKVGLPKYLISKNVYKFPTVTYLDLSGEEVVYKKATLSIFDTKENIITDNLYSVADVDKVLVKYYAEEQPSVLLETEIPVYSLMSGVKLDMSKLFLTDTNVARTANSGNITFATQSNAVIECIQELLAEQFNLDFNVNTEKNNFTEIAIKVSDARNQDLAVVLNLVKANGKTKLYLNNDYVGLEYTISLDFYGNKNANFELKYEETKKAFTINEVSFTPSKYSNGSSFNGFPSRTLTISVEIKGVSGESELKLINLNGQPLSRIPQDNISPNMEILNQTEEILFEKGSVYETPIVIAYDVLCGYSNATISVRQVGGGYLKLEDGRELKDLDASVSYKVVLPEFSEYSVMVKSYDRNELDFRQTIIINVLDEEPPTIKLSSGLESSYKLNSSVTIPKIIVDDNISGGELKGYVVVVNPDDKYEFVADKSYKFTKKGNYKFKFFVYDLAGNLTVIEKNVKVG